MTFERITVHVNNDTGRIAMLETRTVGTDPSPASVARYIYSNHLSTATLELDGSANIISYEEYHPYGTTSFQSNDINKGVAKRYRYTNKERDDETGLYYIGARYYAPWLTRWCAADPINSEWYNFTHGQPARNLKRQNTDLTCSSYEYCYANPVRFIDPTGEQTVPAEAAPVRTVEIDPELLKPQPENEGGRLPKPRERFAESPNPNLIVIPGQGVYYMDYNSHTGAGGIQRVPLTDAQKSLSYPGSPDYPKTTTRMMTMPELIKAIETIKAANAKSVNPQIETKEKEDNSKVEYLYRGMQSDITSQPIIGESARMLGVRPNEDLPIEKGKVFPGTGGMSVAPDNPYNLPPHRRPAGFGGTGKDPVFRIDITKLGPDLKYVRDAPGHGTIQPAREMTYQEYKQALEKTQQNWK